MNFADIFASNLVETLDEDADKDDILRKIASLSKKAY